MKIYKKQNHAIIEYESRCYQLTISNWDAFINRDELHEKIKKDISDLPTIHTKDVSQNIAAPLANQEVWAAGVTYLRSKEARMEEAKDAGGALFYDKVYEADRPELFFKASAQRTVGTNEAIFIRRDSSWDVPEPELTLFVSSSGVIQGYTIGNDVSSRSIEGENPLYLPQAKVFERCAALGPCIYVPKEPIDENTVIQIEIRRDNNVEYADSVSINRMKRSHEELVEYLFRSCEFPYGVFLMTGTCLVPPDSFTLAVGDEVNITIDPIGTLSNYVSMKGL